MDNLTKVFLVCGRNEEINYNFRIFLQSIGLHVISWNEAIAATGDLNPNIEKVFASGMEIANAIIVLFTPDEEVKLSSNLSDNQGNQSGYQPRPNVIYEAGYARGKYPERTFYVTMGNCRRFTDDPSFHIIFDGSVNSRISIIDRLKAAGIETNTVGGAWVTTGKFDSLLINQPNVSSVSEILIDKPGLNIYGTNDIINFTRLETYKYNWSGNKYISPDFMKGNEYKHFVLCNNSEKEEVTKKINSTGLYCVTGDGDSDHGDCRIWFINMKEPVIGIGEFRNNKTNN